MRGCRNGHWTILNLARLLVTTDYSSNIFLMHEFLIGISAQRAETGLCRLVKFW